MKPKITPIPPWQIDTYWQYIAGFIDGAAKHSDYYSKLDVLDALKEERAHLWLVHTGSEIHAAVVTRLKPTKRGRKCEIWALGGKDMNNWVHLIGPIEKWAKRDGCESIQFEGRPGLFKMMKPYGYHVRHVVMKKAL